MSRLNRYVKRCGHRASAFAFALVLCILALWVTSACESADCTLNSQVLCQYGFYDAEGTAVALADSLLYNKGTKFSTLSLPMSYGMEEDTLNLHFFNQQTGLDQVIVVRVKKTNTPHFESPDCPAVMFHQLQDITFTATPGYVDSIKIVSPTVNYATQENIKIYLHTASE